MARSGAESQDRRLCRPRAAKRNVPVSLILFLLFDLFTEVFVIQVSFLAPSWERKRVLVRLFSFSFVLQTQLRFPLFLMQKKLSFATLLLIVLKMLIYQSFLMLILQLFLVCLDTPLRCCIEVLLAPYSNHS